MEKKKQDLVGRRSGILGGWSAIELNNGHVYPNMYFMYACASRGLLSHRAIAVRPSCRNDEAVEYHSTFTLLADEHCLSSN